MENITEQQMKESALQAFEDYGLRDKRLLVIIPDNSRTAPIDKFFSIFYSGYKSKVKKLDYLIALGTHPVLTEEQKCMRMGISIDDRKNMYGDIGIFNHRWDRQDTFTHIGTITGDEMNGLSDGLISEHTEISVNKMIFDYDAVLVLGPVFPHEIAGFSGYTKYLFPGICGWNFIDSTHWLGALKTNIETIGRIDTPVRRMLNHAAGFLSVPIIYFNLVVTDEGLKGLFIGDDEQAWLDSVDLSSKLNIQYEKRRYKTVYSVASGKYDDYWTGAKAFYKLEPIVADGGEIIVYAPGVKEISLTHKKLLNKIGFHVSDYFRAHLGGRYQNVPKTILAYSALVKGKGSYERGIEKSRISHKLAVNMPEEKLTALNLEWADYSKINLNEWKNNSDEDTKVVFNAGEKLFRVHEV